ncbi:MAG: biotin/lipoyl-containing protein [Oscillospiraceae bacterium]
METYFINVNGTDYEVTVKVSGSSAASAPVAAAPVVAAAPAAVAVAEPGEGRQITAPMPGTILSVLVKPGDVVKSGQSLLILEAMKMENEIMAPCDGVITSVTTSVSAAVSTGDILCTIG